MPVKSHSASAVAKAAIAGSGLPAAPRSIWSPAGDESLPNDSAHRRWPMISAPAKSWFPQQ